MLVHRRNERNTVNQLSFDFKKSTLEKARRHSERAERKSEGAESFKMEEEARNVNMRAGRVED